MRSTTKSLLVTALSVTVTAGLLGPATPSSAFTGEKVLIGLGKTLTLNKEPIPGNSTTFQANERATSALPADCEAEPVGCELIPIELQVPEEDPDEIEAKGYILTVELDWDPGQRVDNVPPSLTAIPGTVFLNDLEGFLYQDPLAIGSGGSATFTARSNSTQPASLVAVSPTSKKFQLAIANYSGVNNGYTLKISLTDAAALEFDPSQFNKPGAKAPDFVQPTFDIPKGSPQQNGFGGASGPMFLPPQGQPAAAPVVGGPAVFRVPNIANGKADSRLLAMSNVKVRTGLGLRAVNVTSTVSTFTQKESSGLSIAFGLLALPLLAIAGFLFLLRRKRKGSTAAAPTTA